MSAVDLARSQFARTSIYHFLFLPVTIGLALLTAVLQTRWYRTGQPDHLRLTSSRLGPDLLREVAPRRSRPRRRVGRGRCSAIGTAGLRAPPLSELQCPDRWSGSVRGCWRGGPRY